ncbi:uncharacterized protein LOC124306862 [Neodiprion virginianus]|uniref:uncharacterized protein LOC124306862 n=1 Tax=Neodiprion virginianus TaxID=2961670 RepID=UPI001EE77A84|nr:uncharacterized protein LOC124306862 [Neodiprion virginianus]
MPRVKCPGSSLILLVVFAEISVAAYTSVSFVNGTDQPRPKREVDKLGEPFRYLIFPEGSNVQLIYCMTIGTYAKPQGIFTMGVTAGLAWQLPHRNSGVHRKPAEVYHRRSRRELYPKIEMLLKAQGKDGRACVLKALCRAGRRNATDVGKGSFMREMMHSIFTLPGGSFHEDPMTRYERAHLQSDEDCDQLYPTCLENI